MSGSPNLAISTFAGRSPPMKAKARLRTVDRTLVAYPHRTLVVRAQVFFGLFRALCLAGSAKHPADRRRALPSQIRRTLRGVDLAGIPLGKPSLGRSCLHRISALDKAATTPRLRAVHALGSTLEKRPSNIRRPLFPLANRWKGISRIVGFALGKRHRMTVTCVAKPDPRYKGRSIGISRLSFSPVANLAHRDRPHR